MLKIVRFEKMTAICVDDKGAETGIRKYQLPLDLQVGDQIRKNKDGFYEIAKEEHTKERFFKIKSEFAQNDKKR